MQRPSEVTVNTTISFYDLSLKGDYKMKELDLYNIFSVVYFAAHSRF